MTTPVLPELLYGAAGARGLDRAAIEQFGIRSATLMERAGRAAWHCLVSEWPRARKIVVLCGAGNNGGDGYVLARLAAGQRRRVRVIALSDPAALKGDAGTAARKYLGPRRTTEAFSMDALADADVIVDALLGTGIDREVTGKLREVIDAVNASGKPVLAVDLPSGLNADDGRAMGAAIRAQVTATFIGLKTGLFTGEGPDCAGQVCFFDLAVPPEVYSRVPAMARRIDLAGLSHLLSPRNRTAHKGDFGHVLVVGGDYGFAGAARMAGEAAARTGSGLVSIATRPEHAATIPLARPELMARGIDGPADLNLLLDRATVVAIGPGLGQGDWAVRLLARVFESRLPLVVDADALNLLAREPLKRGNWILTPHPGEAGRLMGISSAAVQSDRLAAALGIQERFGGVAVLKGAGTVIAAAEGMPGVCSAGNPGMASGGMGDVLTGVIAGLQAQGLAAIDAASAGVCLHAAAADLAAAGGERGLLASDLLDGLRQLANPSR